MSPSLLENANRLNEKLKAKLETLYFPLNSVPAELEQQENNSTSKEIFDSLHQTLNGSNNLTQELKNQARDVANLLSSIAAREEKVEKHLRANNNNNNDNASHNTTKKSSSAVGNDDDFNSPDKRSLLLPAVVHFDIGKLLLAPSTPSKIEAQKKKSNDNDNDDNCNATTTHPAELLSLPQLDLLLNKYFPQVEADIQQLKKSALERKQRMIELKAKIEADMKNDEEETTRQEIAKLLKTVEGLVAARSVKEAASLYLMAENMVNSVQNPEMRSSIQTHFSSKMLECEMKVGTEAVQLARQKFAEQNSASMEGGNNNTNSSNGGMNGNDDDDDQDDESDIEMDMDEALEELD